MIEGARGPAAPGRLPVAIIGGGISGLALTHHLAEAGHPSILLEAAREPGGVIRTVDLEGQPLDLGPQRTRVTDDVRELVEAAGLVGEMIEAPPDASLHVLRGGRLHRVPRSFREVIGTDLLGTREKLRLLAEPLASVPSADETVAAYFTRRFGGGAYRALLGPFYGGIYGSDPARMYVRHSLAPTLERMGVRRSILWALLVRGGLGRKTPPAVSFRGGMERFPKRLARRYRDRVHLGRRAVGLRRSPAGGWRIFIEPSLEMPVEADRVVLACPAGPAADLLDDVAMDAATRLRRLHYNPLAVVHVMAEDPDRQLDGFGFQVAFPEPDASGGSPLETRGATWTGTLFGRTRAGETLCAIYLGGMARPDLATWPDDRIAGVAVRELASVTGLTARAIHVSRPRMPAWDTSWAALDGLELPSGIHVCANWWGRPGIPGRAASAKALAQRLVREAAADGLSA